MLLRVCVHCRRHVGASETACPFCRTQLAPPATRPALAAARLGRAAIFAGATITSGCWTSSSSSARDTTVQKQEQVAPNPGIPPGTIRGVVRDQNGAYVPNFPVVLEAENGTTINATTDAHGEFEFRGLEPGNYTVSYQPNNPRQTRATAAVTLQPEQGERAELTIYPPPIDRGPCCKPYGAPPARKRLV
jgi:carboxypeptidase family protein